MICGWRNRWYEPHTGRFLSEDPTGLAGGINQYAYAGGDAVNLADPLGLCPDGTIQTGTTYISLPDGGAREAPICEFPETIDRGGAIALPPVIVTGHAVPRSDPDPFEAIDYWAAKRRAQDLRMFDDRVVFEEVALSAVVGTGFKLSVGRYFTTDGRKGLYYTVGIAVGVDVSVGVGTGWAFASLFEGPGYNHCFGAGPYGHCTGQSGEMDNMAVGPTEGVSVTWTGTLSDTRTFLEKTWY